MEHELLPFIKLRYSPLAFSDKIVEPEKLKVMFEAASRAPSSYNNQPWQFIYAMKTDKALYDRMLNCLVDANKIWAKTAPVLILVASRDYYPFNNKKNETACYETGMAVSNFITQGMSMGIYCHQMGGFDRQAAIKALKIPDGHTPIVMMAVGYLGDISILPQALHERAVKRTTRNSLDTFVFYGEYKT